MKKMKKLTAHYSIVAMKKVLAEINKIGFPVKEVTYDHWSNGREQGYHICYNRDASYDNWRAVCFAQQRNSDDILVVFGPAREFDVSTNSPSEKVWENGRKHFMYDESDKAAKFIVNYLMGKISS